MLQGPDPAPPRGCGRLRRHAAALLAEQAEPLVLCRMPLPVHQGENYMEVDLNLTNCAWVSRFYSSFVSSLSGQTTVDIAFLLEGALPPRCAPSGQHLRVSCQRRAGRRSWR